MNDDLITRVRDLEARSAPLHPDGAGRASLLAAAGDYGERYLAALPDLPTLSPGDGAGVAALPIAEGGYPLERIFEVLERDVDGSGIQEPSPNFYGYIPSGNLYAGAVGDFLAALGGRYVGATFAAPGGVRVERTLLRWLAGELGMPDTVGGDLTSGGSLATVSAVAAARTAHDVGSAEVPRSVVYLSEQTHHAFAKALNLTGMAEAPRRLVPLDERHRMRLDALEAMVRADREAGLRPWLLAATAGTTDAGAVDPLPALADLADAEGLWFHVDGAYGAAFALCDEGKRILDGIGRADSLVIDPHKGLFIPYGSGALLVRDWRTLYRAHAHDAAYMRDAATLGEGSPISQLDMSPELTRPFRGLRMWLPLMLSGAAPFRAALEEKLLLARHAHRRLAELPEFEVGPAPDLSIVTFRALPSGGDADAFNRELAERIQRDGRIFLSSTLIGGRVTLRLAVLNVHVHLDHIERAIAVVAELAERLRRGEEGSLTAP